MMEVGHLSNCILKSLLLVRGDTFSGQQSMGSGYRVSIFPELDSFVCGLMGQVLNRKVEVSAWKLFYDQMSGVRKLSLQVTRQAERTSNALFSSETAATVTTL